MKYRLIIKYILFAFLGLFTLESCEKVLTDFDFLESDPKLVVNAPFITDSTLFIHVSHTIGIMDDDKFTYVNNAVAELYSNSNLLSTANYIDSGKYFFDVIPQAGETYTLKVVSPDYPATEATIEMPAKPNLELVEYIGWDDYGTRLDISIKDQPNCRNAYGLSMEAAFGWFEMDEFGVITDTTIDHFGYTNLISSDINVTGGFWDYSLSTEQWSDYFDGTTLLIEDDYVNGKEFTVGVSAQELYFTIISEEELRISLEAYSEEYIKFQRSLELYDNSIENPIAEKVTLYSNIEGGLGMAFGKTVVKYKYVLPPEAIDGYKPYY